MQMPDDELDRREITIGRDHARFENGKAGYVKAPINRFQTALWVNAPRGRWHGIHCLPEDHASHRASRRSRIDDRENSES